MFSKNVQIVKMATKIVMSLEVHKMDLNFNLTARGCSHDTTTYILIITCSCLAKSVGFLSSSNNYSYSLYGIYTNVKV